VQVNFRNPFDTRLPCCIKTGVRMRSQKGKQDADRAVYNCVGNDKMSFYDSGYNYSSYDAHPALPFFDVPKIAAAIRNNPADFDFEYRRSRNDLYTTMWKMGIRGRF
jgi:hypothetical protein